MFEIRDLESLLQLFNIDKKRELVRYCRDLVIYSSDFVSLILAGQTGVLEPYLYANQFMDKVPEQLHPSDKERNAMGEATVGALEGKSRKFVRKVFQIFKDRRYFSCAPLLHTLPYLLAFVLL